MPGAAAETSPYHPPLSAHLLYLSAGTLPSAQTDRLHLPWDPGWRGKEDNAKLESTEKDDSCWGQPRLTSTENTHGYPGRQIQCQSFSLLAVRHKPFNRFLWRPPTLWWVIKAYLRSGPKGSEAPERRCVWSDIFVQLHSLPCCHDLSYSKKKKGPWAWGQYHVSHTCELPLFYQGTIVHWLATAVIWLHRMSSHIPLNGAQTKKRDPSLPAESPEVMFPLVSIFLDHTWDHLEQKKDGGWLRL